ncbi:MAG: alpha/beta fold hydrolase [Bryobacteraceae bacterium]|jgi:dipeptidyl aminopeptidase/acylaminoacyl peptidase
MVRRFVLLAAACAASAQQAPFTLEQVLGFAFPTELTAAPAGGMVAWVSNARGVRNIMVAEPPGYQSRPITRYTEDDGQEIAQLGWLPDASAIVYTRGGTANPALDPKGVAQAVWLAALDGAAPRKIGDGASPAVSPRDGRIAYTLGGQLWLAPSNGSAPASLAFQDRGQAVQPVWSPDGARVAFTSDRGDHSLIGVYDAAAGTARYLDPSTDSDGFPEWSPDGRAIAFIRIPSSGLRQPRQAQRAGQPWSLRVVTVETGAGREVWRAREGPGSVFRGVTARNQVLWADGRLVFPWEADGWTHLYSVPADGGAATLLTPGAFEVEDVALAPNRRDIVYSSNQGDIDRRHLWRVAAAGGSPSAITTGQGIECSPAPLSDGGTVAFLRSDAKLPLRAAIRVGGEVRDMDPGAIPADFPAARMVVPQQVIFRAADGLEIHGQLFLPANRAAAAVPAPAVIFFHGGPRRQMLLGWHYMGYYSNAYALNQYLANSGYAVLSVNFRSGIGYGLDFREAASYGASGASEYADVLAAATYLRSRSGVDPARIGVWGGSYGGYLTAMALARNSDLFRAGLDFHGVHDWARELRIPPTDPDYKLAFDSSPMAFVATWRSPVLLIAGDDDPDVQFNQTVMLAGALRKQNVQVEELIFPDEVHEFLLYRTWLTAYRAAARFLDERLK